MSVFKKEPVEKPEKLEKMAQSRARFEAFWPQLLKWEGTKYENDPDDPGGATKFGIDQRSNPGVDIRSLTEAVAKDLYWRNDWLENDCGNLPFPMGEVHFDACVNTGAGQAKKFLMRSQNSREYNGHRRNFYRKLAIQSAKRREFLRGWMNRVDDLDAWIAKQNY